MTVDAKKRFGARLKAAREELKMTQGDLASLLGVSGAVISDWEKGKSSPQLERLEAIAACLNRPVSSFFTDPWETTGLSAGNLAFYVRVYSNTIKHLRKLEQESQRAAIAFAQLREHLAAQAAMLLKSVTAEEMSQIHLDDLDESISEKSESHTESGEIARDKLAAEAYQTLANLEAAMEGLTGKAKAKTKAKSRGKGSKS